MKALWVILILGNSLIEAIAGPNPATVSLGAPTLRPNPDGAGSLLYPITVKNTSSKPIWVYGPTFYSAFVRAADAAPWKQIDQADCGIGGARFHKIAPGDSDLFTVMFSARRAGQQLRIELPIYQAPNPAGTPLVLTSASTPIREPAK